MDFRESLNNLPIIFADTEHMEKDNDGKIKNWPKFPCWCTCEYFTWSLKMKDFVKQTKNFWFDGTNFHLVEDLFNFDNADWISKIVDWAILKI